MSDPVRDAPEELDPMQRHHRTRGRLPISPGEVRWRARAYLVGFLLLPWAFLAGAAFNSNEAIILPSVVLTAVGILSVKYAFPSSLSTGKETADIEAAARVVGLSPVVWTWVMRVSLGIGFVSLAIGFARMWG